MGWVAIGWHSGAVGSVSASQLQGHQFHPEPGLRSVWCFTWISSHTEETQCSGVSTKCTVVNAGVPIVLKYGFV